MLASITFLVATESDVAGPQLFTQFSHTMVPPAVLASHDSPPPSLGFLHELAPRHSVLPPHRSDPFVAMTVSIASLGAE